MKKALIIYNPGAGIKSGSDVSAQVQKKLQKMGYSSSIFFLDPNFEKNIEGFDFTGVKLVVAIGGDGTVKVATRTILENKLGAKLAIIPFGSANIIAKSMGLPISISKSIKMLNEREPRPIDVGIINGKHYFIVGFSTGYVSEIVANTSAGLKNRYGFMGYVINLLAKNREIRRNRFWIDNGVKRHFIKGHSLIVFNACNFYGFKPKMPIMPNDGILNLVVMTNKNFWTMITAGIHFLAYREPRQYFFSLASKKFKIKLKKKSHDCQVDGDSIDLPKEMEIKIIPGAIKVMNYAK